MATRDARAAVLSGRVARAVALSVAGAVAVGAGLVALFPVDRADSPPATAVIPEPSLSTAVGEATPAPTTGSQAAGREALDHAGETLREGRFEAAALEYEAIAADRATDAEVRALAIVGAGVARFEGGDHQGAIANLRAATGIAPAGSAVARRSAYLLGLRLGETDAAAEAVEVLRPLVNAGVSDALQPYITAEYAKAAAKAGDGASAATAWGSLLSTGGLDPALRAAIYEDRAAAARAAGDREALTGWLAKLAEATANPVTRHELATVARERGDGATFAAQLRALIGESPGSKEAVFAVSELREAGYTVDTGQEGLVFYRRGAFAEARRVLAAAVNEPGISAGERAFRYYYLAAANEDAGNAAAAVEYYDIAAAQGAATPYTHRAKYWAARVTEGLGDARSAAARYQDLAVNGPGGEFSGEAHFRAGYTLFRGGDTAGAVASWESLGPEDDARLLYWKGRALESLGDSAGAMTAYEQAARVDPLAFYGIEAARAAGEGGALDVSFRPLPKVTAPDWEGIAAWLAGIVPGHVEWKASTAAGQLMSVGLRARAATTITEAAKEADAQRLLALAREAYEAHLADVAAGLAVRIRDKTGVKWHEVPLGLMQLAYPLDYVVYLELQGRAYDVDPLFLAGLVRQESLWDAAAVSRVGAIGLTQVMPATGEGIARALGAEFEVEDLLRPAVSLQFGAYYLASQLGRFGDPLLALAAYNAGPGNARRWATDGEESASDFVERVDIPETQHYVEQVIEHYAHYRAAYQ